ncbi:RNA polymerase subunit sigma-70 [Rhizobium sp. R72]|uniref:sigma-70 family RNA polymerase sigma factor n=1 Tax=unclassified Rhizobium TaxID=2613769 RepID=UPI000B53744C|nr:MULTISPECIES: sigma-70 family RNA polymerase sigma factor [unclassified Rhizobium]OWW04688.1 RNA polymerase subunit sigma-70 [Rhizobium sp. R72]OWW05745.1 RNA polymerase subunit sigma-70 [Rhizobium sp. R711]
MIEKNWVTGEFEANRAHLSAVAYRMLGSRAEADDAVQEAWLRLGRSDAETIDNVGGWLTTVVARICLDMLRSRKTRREEPFDLPVHERVAGPSGAVDPEREVAFADSVGLALLVVLERLAPAERVAFVLHDMFDLPFDDIAPIIRRSSAATRQLASRARRRVQGRTDVPEADAARKKQIVNAFLAASRLGDIKALLSILDPQVVFTPDAAAMQYNPSVRELRGADAVADTFKGRAQAAQPAMIDKEFGLVVAVEGQLRVVLLLTFDGEKIAAIDALADPEYLGNLKYDLLCE